MNEFQAIDSVVGTARCAVRERRLGRTPQRGVPTNA